MKTRTFFVVISLFILSFSFSQKNILTNESIINFKAKAFGFGVKGTIVGMEGTAIFNPNNLPESKFNACIKPSTLHTNNKKRDSHLKSDDFFDVINYPKICFISDKVMYVNGEYITKGKLTMHGITKEIQFPFTYSNKTLVGHFTVNRKDYNIGSEIKNTMASNTIHIEIRCRVR